jgi:mannose-6-phosphate isomerase-like protein (cupin superfamily)
VLQAVRFKDAEVFQLTGRQVRYLIGPKTVQTERVTVGVCNWPQGAAPSHIHTTEDEIIYIISGTGVITSPEGSIDLDPGTAVLIQQGTHHYITSHGPEDLQFVTIFSPPVVFGEYK